jgi:hypothetical protein
MHTFELTDDYLSYSSSALYWVSAWRTCCTAKVGVGQEPVVLALMLSVCLCNDAHAISAR